MNADMERGTTPAVIRNDREHPVQEPDGLDAPPPPYGADSPVGNPNVYVLTSPGSSTSALIDGARGSFNPTVSQRTTAPVSFPSMLRKPGFFVACAAVAAASFGITFASLYYTTVQPLKHQVAAQEAMIAALENTTYPIYAKLMPQTPVSLYNQAYNTNYADNFAGQAELFAQHQMPWNASLPVNIGYNCASEMMKANCSIPGMFYQQLGTSDLRLLTDNRNDTAPVGVLINGEAPNLFNFYVPEPLNVTGVRGPMPVDLSTQASEASYNNAGYQPAASSGVGSFRPSLNGKALDANTGVVLASPLKNGISTGFLLSVADDQGAYSLTLQLRSTNSEAIFYCDDSDISHVGCQK